MITSKSLYHSNITVLFEEKYFKVPDNSIFASMFSGVEAAGAQFFDNPVMQTKMLSLPALKLKIILEKTRLRIEDESENTPQESNAPKIIHRVVGALFSDVPVKAYGFNYDIYYRFNTFIPIKEIYGTMFSPDAGDTRDLLDIGIQFTVEHQKKHYKETWFFKIVSPLELAAHVNRHFDAKKIPNEADLLEQFVSVYEEADATVKTFKFNI